MRRGTTPTFVFTLPFDTKNLSKARVIFEHSDDVKLIKVVEKDNFDGNKITITLTQEETLLFYCNSYIKVQLRVLTANNEVLASDVNKVFVCECLDDEVME